MQNASSPTSKVPIIFNSYNTIQIHKYSLFRYALRPFLNCKSLKTIQKPIIYFQYAITQNIPIIKIINGEEQGMMEMKRTQKGQGLQLHVQQLRLTMGSSGTQKVWVALPPAQTATLGPAPLCVFCFSWWLSYDPGFSRIPGSPLQPKLHLQSTI